ncbi:MAG: hypothetical protein KC466_03125, partial [Myxococcales bacterium]|nr:hypothetical protein [Myxococcales bacterium]
MQILIEKTASPVARVLGVFDTTEDERRHAESLALLDREITRLQGELDALLATPKPDVQEVVRLQNKLSAARARREAFAGALDVVVQAPGPQEETRFVLGPVNLPQPVAVLDWDKRIGAFVVNLDRKANLDAAEQVDRDRRAAWKAAREAHLGAAREDLTPEVVADLVFVLATEAGL